MNKDISEWSKRCLLCIKLAGGDLIPRPMVYQLRSTQPMEVISIDYMAGHALLSEKVGVQGQIGRRRPVNPGMHHGPDEG